MSSQRFPGKMLSPLAGRPLIAHLLMGLEKRIPKDRIILLTSDDATDDPLALYVKNILGFFVFRGPLENVAFRFQSALRSHPCHWFVRISGDSPCMDAELIQWMLEKISKIGNELDLLTNVGRRTFPPGESVEIVRTRIYEETRVSEWTAEEREHATTYFYHHPDRFRIRNVSSSDPSHISRRLVVDTLEDFQRLDAILKTSPELASGYAASAVLDPVGS